MAEQHPLTPPPELVQQWWAEETYDPFGVALSNLAARAAQWGADQEFEAGTQLLDINGCPGEWIDMLRAARHLKPPSLKQQGLDQLDSIRGLLEMKGLRFDSILNALEALPND